MAESTTSTNVSFTPYAPLAALGLYLRQIDFLAPIRTHLKIAQKKVVHTPLDKLTDAFITVLAGAHGLVEVNTRLRSDRALQQAFGRERCADQSTKGYFANQRNRRGRQLGPVLASHYGEIVTEQLFEGVG